ncbi:MAG: CoA transferase, partial [Pseudoflavonifractor sp.]
MEKTGFPEKPTRIAPPLSYYYGSWHLTAGMLAAYLQAQTTGEGQKVSTSAWQCIMSIDDTYAQCLLGMNELPRRIANGFPTTNPTDTFHCKNGWFSLSIGSDQQWWAFSKAAGRNDWIEDPRYSHDPVRSMENYFGDLDQQLRDYFATITIEEADRICREAMAPGGPCNTVKELVTDPQVADRQMLLDVHGMTQLGKAAKFLRDNEHDNELAPAPALGADTAAVLTAAHFTSGEVDALKADGVL